MITEYIVKNLKENGVLDSKDEVLVQYGLNGLLSTFFSSFSIILIGLCCNCFTESIVFTISFFFLRIYAGGYHASTPLKCYGISITISIIVFYIIRSINLNNMSIIIIFVISSIIILVLAPVDTINKPLDIIERSVYKKRIVEIVKIYVAVFLVSLVTGQFRISWSISLAVCTTSILQILPKINIKKEVFYEKNN